MMSCDGLQDKGIISLDGIVVVGGIVQCSTSKAYSLGGPNYAAIE